MMPVRNTNKIFLPSVFTGGSFYGINISVCVSLVFFSVYCENVSNSVIVNIAVLTASIIL